MPDAGWVSGGKWLRMRRFAAAAVVLIAMVISGALAAVNEFARTQ
jgi:hypothetical protein